MDAYGVRGGELEANATLELIRKYAPVGIDLADPLHERNAHDVADMLLELLPEGLEALQADAAQPAVLRLAASLALAKRCVLALNTKFHLTVVIPLFAQHKRILPRAEHEEGEDFLRRKIGQLEWLFGEFKNLKTIPWCVCVCVACVAACVC